MLELILCITIAHLLGDFVFQSNTMVLDIRDKGLKSKYLYLHSGIHFVLLLVCTFFQAQYIFAILLLSLSHLLIDALTKVGLKNRLNQISIFLVDQVLHAITLLAFVYNLYPFTLDYSEILTPRVYLAIATLLFLSSVSSIFIKKIMDSFNYKIPSNGLPNAGKYIGILERLLIFYFVVMNIWEGVGFLLAAKSIFRFGDLKQNKEIRLTEYILIGTLVSFAIAIGIGLLYKFLTSTLAL